MRDDGIKFLCRFRRIAVCNEHESETERWLQLADVQMEKQGEIDGYVSKRADIEELVALLERKLGTRSGRTDAASG